VRVQARWTWLAELAALDFASKFGRYKLSAEFQRETWGDQPPMGGKSRTGMLVRNKLMKLVHERSEQEDEEWDIWELCPSPGAPYAPNSPFDSQFKPDAMPSPGPDHVEISVLVIVLLIAP
jgi:hypothetical protein